MLFSARFGNQCLMWALCGLLACGAAFGAELGGRQVAVAPASQTQEAEGLMTQANWGVFIGVDAFEDPTVSRLNFCRRDAMALKAMLTGEDRLIPPSQSYLLATGEAGLSKPTRKNILRTILQVCHKAGPDSLILISISTHGFTGNNGQAYVLPQDGEQSLLRDTAVSVARINEMLEMSQAPRKVLIVDACREPSEAGQRSAGSTKMSADFHEALEAAAGQITLASCGRGEIAFEDPMARHGVFTRYLLEGLQGAAPANKDGFITVMSLCEYVRDKTEVWCNENQKPLQQPWVTGRIGRDIPLARAGSLQAVSVEAAQVTPEPAAAAPGAQVATGDAALDAALNLAAGGQAPTQDAEALKVYERLAALEQNRPRSYGEVRTRLNGWKAYLERYGPTAPHADQAREYRDQWAEYLKWAPPANSPYRTAFEASLNKNLDLKPIEVEARRHYDVQPGPRYLLIKKVGADLHDVLVREDGGIVVLLQDYLRNGVEDVGKAYGSFRLIVDDVIKPVRADIAEDTAWKTWYGDLQVYNAQGNIYSRIVLMNTGRDDKILGVLSVPNTDVKQAYVSFLRPNDFDFMYQVGDVKGNVRDRSSGSVNITQTIRYGERRVHCYYDGWGAGFDYDFNLLVFHFITDPLTGQFILYDDARKSMGEVMPRCRPISELQLPFLGS